MGNTINDQDKAKIEKMQAAFDEFSKNMAELKQRGITLVSEKLSEINESKIQEVLDKIKNIPS